MSLYNTQNSYAKPSAFYALRLTDFEMLPHSHHRCEIMYVVSGACTIVLNTGQQLLRERQLVFLDQDVSHCLLLHPEAPCSMLNLEFTCSSTPASTDILLLSQRDPPFHRFLSKQQPLCFLGDNGRMEFALKDLIAQLEQRDQDGDFLMHLLLQRVLLELARCGPIKESASGVLHLKNACRFIAQNLREEIDVPRVSDAAGVNRSYLQDLFSKSFGCGIMAYIHRLRMEHASFLLKNSSLAITDIAFHLGYNSRQQFGYVFDRHFHMSPRCYRKLTGQNLETDTGAVQRELCESGEVRSHLLMKDPPTM